MAGPVRRVSLRLEGMRVAGKRNWWVVRRALMTAIEGCTAKNANLMHHVFVPEMFRSEERENILARRNATLAPVRATSDTMMVVIGEIKEVAPSQFGEKISLKHLPDWPLFMDSDMARRFHKRFAIEEELGVIVLYVQKVSISKCLEYRDKLSWSAGNLLMDWDILFFAS